MADQNAQNSGGTIDLRTGQSGAQGAAAPQGGTPAAGGAAAQSGASAAGGGATAQPQKTDAIPSQFEVPDAVKQKYPDLIPLIIKTESMNDEERQYWFQIMPIMTEDQVGKLREILVNEKKQLEALDQEYQEELKRINDKHTSDWKEFEAKEKRKKLQATESHSEEAEKASEEELLKKLGNL